MATPFLPVPDWFPWENQGADIAVADIDGDGQPDLVVFQIDNPAGKNEGYYRIGWNLTNGAGVTGGWTAWIAVPDWFPWENQGAGIAVADIDGNGRPDLVIFQIDNPPGKNEGYYRIGWNLNTTGNVTGGWGPWQAVPDWPFWENQGASVALADIDGDGRPDLIVFQIDNPGGKNDGYYRIGWNLDNGGNVTGGWGPWQAVPDWPFWENQGAGIAIADLDGNGQLDLVVLHIDNPLDANSGLYCIGRDLNVAGVARGGWGGWTNVPGWLPWENQGGGIALADLDADGVLELVVLQADKRAAQNAAFYRVLDLVLNGVAPEVDGVWRILPFDSQVLAIHAALLHTGKVLFFAGSSNNPTNNNPIGADDFRSVVWDYDAGTFFSPPTPIDFFCAGQSFLADGRLLVAGGTKTYDPFFGLPDAFVFDPHDEQWKVVPPMTGGRWYPTLVTLGDGRVLAMSGLGEFGEDPYQDLEVYTENPAGWTTLPPSLSHPWPLYAHVFLLEDGRLCYTGGQYNQNYDQNPCLIDLSMGTVTVVDGLHEQDHRNQSASALLPPAQDGRLILIGGGAPFGGPHHHAVQATNQVSIVQPLAAAPVYQAAAPLTWGRMHHCAVILPDRTLLVCGGSGLDESRELARLTAEIFDPATNAWSLATTARVQRLYHSVALLMPDGRVITAGSNPQRGDEELRIEVYHPSYLFRGPRPVIDAAPVDLTHGATITIDTPQAGDIHWVSLVRPGATTHTLDTEQRLVDVPFSQGLNATLTATIPTEPNLAPPGWYMLFITNTDGVPSVAKWVHLQ